MTLYWTSWLVLFALLFVVGETYALKRGRLTLSMWTYRLWQRWPLIAVIFGLLVGGFAVHVWWHWCPPGSTSAG